MWGDVEKTLRRYVDDPVLFKHMIARLKTSQELIEIGKVVTDKETRKTEAVFTTQSMLAHETPLVTYLRTLAGRSSHPVEKSLVQHATQKLHQQLEAHRGLSEDQQQALQHMLGFSSILNCWLCGVGQNHPVRGAQEAWEQAGYTVYGLAPTGKASENLRAMGIQSQVLHKFLWQYDQGRCQYNSQSVLILDEAGMVDVPRFDRLLKAVDHLGVKLVMMGDGGQLQAIEAGDAFRMITSSLQRSRSFYFCERKTDCP